jgi:two-component system, response regulator PdtaR
MGALLTIDPPTHAEPVAETRSVKLPAKPTSVLVADDEHLIATGLAKQLRNLGYQVVGPATDGESAIACCKASRPDIALLDIRMPRMDGLAAAAVIFGQLGIPTIIITAYAEPEYIETATRHGVFGYALKPISPEQLHACIEIAWGRFLDQASRTAEVQTLKQRLEDRKVIEQAKWIIVSRKGIDEPEAMKLLQRQARNTRRTLADMACSVIENDDLFTGP